MPSPPSPRVRAAVVGIWAFLLAGAAAGAGRDEAASSWLRVWPLSGPCAGNCAVSVYSGALVEQGMTKVLVGEPSFPTEWDYAEDYIVATALSRRLVTLWNHLDVEPEIGVGRRFGEQDETEVWAAFFLRYRGFPWDDHVVTSFAVSTGFNYASAISDVEQDRARDDKGSQLMHFFSPEITFALPRHPQYELLFRFHHRSGVFGLVSDAWGGAQYGTVGLRWRF